MDTRKNKTGRISPLLTFREYGLLTRKYCYSVLLCALNCSLFSIFFCFMETQGKTEIAF